MSETDIKKAIQVAIVKLGHRLWVNNCGALKDATGRYVTYGLSPGSSDLIGMTSTGRFLAIEVKEPGSYTKADHLKRQEDFIAMVRLMGGIGFFARSVDEALAQLAAWI